MTKEQTSLVIGAVLSCVIAILAAFGYNVVVVQPQMAAIEQTQSEMLAIVQVLAMPDEQGLVGQSVTGFTSVNVEQDLAVGDDTTLADATVDDWFGITPSTTISVTAGSIITPTGTLQPLTSGSAVTTSTSTAIANGTTSGQLLILHNKNATDAITIDGAGANVECGGNQAIGPTDTLVLHWQTDDWECVAKFGF